MARTGGADGGGWRLQILRAGAPLGLGGAAVDVDVHEAFSLWAGAGKGMMGGDLQVAIGGRWHLWKRDDGRSMGFGTGASYGRVWFIVVEDGTEWSPAPWIFLEWFMEKRWQAGLRMRFVLGGSAHLGTSDCVAAAYTFEAAHCTSPVQVLPYAGLALGWGI